MRRADADALAKLTPRADSKVFKVTFNTDTSDNMPWKFRPIQRAVKLGELLRRWMEKGHGDASLRVFSLRRPFAAGLLRHLCCPCSPLALLATTDCTVNSTVQYQEKLRSPSFGRRTRARRTSPGLRPTT